MPIYIQSKKLVLNGSKCGKLHIGKQAKHCPGLTANDETMHFGEVAKGEIQSEFWQNLIVKSVESESSPRNISEVVPRSKIYGLIVQK